MNKRKPKMALYVDAFSYCNLRCPTCIVGANFSSKRDWPRGLMTVDMLTQILDKAQTECELTFVGLHNWTEPLLHPNVATLVREIKRRGLKCRLSSNLNVAEKFDFVDLMLAGPDYLRISVSGFTQPIYAVGHHGGNIALVKRNMTRLSQARLSSAGNPGVIDVLYHIYKHNQHEIAAMRDFSLELGFSFSTIFAQMFPVEKLIAIRAGHTTESERILMSQLALPLERALDLTARNPAHSCSLAEQQIVVDVAGNVMLCCGASMSRENALGHFLSLSLDEIQALKRKHQLCGPCMQINIPAYFSGSAELNALASAGSGC